MNLSLAHRPIANRYIRIDEMGRAQAIQYSDLNYSPREGEVRTYLTIGPTIAIPSAAM